MEKLKRSDTLNLSERDKMQIIEAISDKSLKAPERLKQALRDVRAEETKKLEHNVIKWFLIGMLMGLLLPAILYISKTY